MSAHPSEVLRRRTALGLLLIPRARDIYATDNSDRQGTAPASFRFVRSQRDCFPLTTMTPAPGMCVEGAVKEPLPTNDGRSSIGRADRRWTKQYRVRRGGHSPLKRRVWKLRNRRHYLTGCARTNSQLLQNGRQNAVAGNRCQEWGVSRPPIKPSRIASGSGTPARAQRLEAGGRFPHRPPVLLWRLVCAAEEFLHDRTGQLLGVAVG